MCVHVRVQKAAAMPRTARLKSSGAEIRARVLIPSLLTPIAQTSLVLSFQLLQEAELS